MAAPVASYLQIADDTGYTGKVRKIRNQSRVVGANTVYEQYIQNLDSARIVGVYRANTSQLTVSATVQDGTASGMLWMTLPSSVPTGRYVQVRAVAINSHLSTVLVARTAPRLMLSRFTWTGSPTGADVRPDWGDGDPMFDIRTAITDMTVSMGANIHSFPIAGDLSAVSAYAPSMSASSGASRLNIISVQEDDCILLAAGEGLVLWQDVAGTAADTRKFNVQIFWDEIDAA